MKPEKKRLDRIENPDVEISARVKARKLRFEEVPETSTRALGSPGREFVSGTERENLPDEVTSGVTYRNSRVRLRIAGKLAGDGSDRREGGG
ncbi:hypothetical protein GBA65_16130 [Rubrobacter marinus]|uniref:Uncharacterized protein n=1 Tax=Rubrobacter marinus TaxID=2653852 RepID=A0A6G8Q031_9ACTN|nr:hypothetical protein [Rubrobacter marinus]QIN79805.1 hypothetical protein GBA65_16130 [Rubrobacter marinus]